MLRLALLVAFFGLSQCKADESVAGYGAADRVWVLTEIDGAPFTARATLTFPERGQVAGQAPCNTYSGVMVTPYPWFDLGQVAATRMACPDLKAEARFFETLTEMTLSEVSGDVLILSTPDGRQMVFKSAE
jgi:heat shock protein HslJ